jgi:hypothetical protein
MTTNSPIKTLDWDDLPNISENRRFVFYKAHGSPHVALVEKDGSGKDRVLTEHPVNLDGPLSAKESIREIARVLREDQNRRDVRAQQLKALGLGDLPQLTDGLQAALDA